MSSQEKESSSQRDDNTTQPSNEGSDRTETAASAADTRETSQQTPPHPPPQQQHQDLFGMLANILPQAMEGIVNSMLAPRAPAQGEQTAAGAAPHEQAVPPLPAGIDRVVDILNQQRQLWEGMGETMNRMQEDRRRRADETTNNADPMQNVFVQLGGAFNNWPGHQPPPHNPSAPPPPSTAPSAPPLPTNFIDHLTAAAAGLAGTGATGGGGGGNGQSFMDRLQAATAASAAQPGTSGGQQPPLHTHVPMGNEAHANVIDIPFGRGVHIHFATHGGEFGNMDNFLRQLRERFDPAASSGNRIPDEDLRRLPNSSVRKNHVEDGKQCFICMDQYTEVGERVAELSCGHIFHSNCIVPWLKRNTTCPVCRGEVDSSNWKHEEMELD